MDDHLLIVCHEAWECARMRRAFPEAYVIAENTGAHGLRARAILITPRVDTQSHWFQTCVRTRLGVECDGNIFRLYPV